MQRTKKGGTAQIRSVTRFRSERHGRGEWAERLPVVISRLFHQIKVNTLKLRRDAPVMSESELNYFPEHESAATIAAIQKTLRVE